MTWLLTFFLPNFSLLGPSTLDLGSGMWQTDGETDNGHQCQCYLQHVLLYLPCRSSCIGLRIVQQHSMCATRPKGKHFLVVVLIFININICVFVWLSHLRCSRLICSAVLYLVVLLTGKQHTRACCRITWSHVTAECQAKMVRFD